MTWRHATNCRVPFEPVDIDLLCILEDYRIGEPVPATVETALPLDALRAQGFVGLYLSDRERERPIVQRRFGGPVAGGAEWRP